MNLIYLGNKIFESRFKIRIYCFYIDVDNMSLHEYIKDYKLKGSIDFSDILINYQNHNILNNHIMVLSNNLCIKYFENWFDPEKFDFNKYGELLVKYYLEYKDIWSPYYLIGMIT